MNVFSPYPSLAHPPFPTRRVISCSYNSIFHINASTLPPCLASALPVSHLPHPSSHPSYPSHPSHPSHLCHLCHPSHPAFPQKLLQACTLPPCSLLCAIGHTPRPTLATFAPLITLPLPKGLDSATLFSIVRHLSALCHHLHTTYVVSLLQVSEHSD